MKIVNLSIIASLIFTIAGCNITTDEEVVIFDIDNDFEGQLRESLTTSGSELFLELTSQDAVPCEEARLDYHIVDQDVLEIELLRFTRPMVCNTSIVQPVIAQLPIPRSEKGIHDMHIIMRNSFVNEGYIEIQSDRYQINLEVDKGFQVQSRTLMKTQPNMIWGVIETEIAVNIEDMIDQLNSDVAQHTDIEPFLTGTYTKFYVGDNGDILIRDVEITTSFKTFGFIAANEALALSTLLSVKANLPEGVMMTIYTGTGKMY